MAWIRFCKEELENSAEFMDEIVNKIKEYLKGVSEFKEDKNCFGNDDVDDDDDCIEIPGITD